MSGFDPAWLALRETADARSRAAMSLERVRRRRAGQGPERILDLATGTGANLRYLAPRIGGRQEWLLTDADQRLLDVLPDVMQTWACSAGYGWGGAQGSGWISGPGFHCAFRLLRIDLAKRLARLPIQGKALVTASALLDLVSPQWIEDLVERCLAAGADVLFALTYDGRIEFEPALVDDSLVIGLVNRHQRTDKGFGPAMGPAAPNMAQAKLLDAGYRVLRRSSDWRIGVEEPELQANLIRGWANAAIEMVPEYPERIGKWCADRLELLVGEASQITIGHQDLLGLRD